MKKNSLFLIGKQSFLTSIIFLILGICNIAYSQNNQNMVNCDFYKSYKKIKYQDLPNEIRKIMKDSKCGEIGADPSPANDYKTNYDDGYIIDLNDDNFPEYIFSCEAPSHGAGNGKIYSLINGNWKIICDNFPVYVCEPKNAIKVLVSKTGEYHDLERDDILTTRKVIEKYINGKYLDIYLPNEAIEQIMFFMDHYSKNIKSCFIGLTNKTTDINLNEILRANYTEEEKNSLIIYALDSEEQANNVKSILISKGMNILDKFSKGQIVFCFSNDPK